MSKSKQRQNPTLKERIEFLWEANSLGMDCLYPHSGSDPKEIQSEYDRILPLYPEFKARYDAERAEIIRSADEFLALYRETRAVSLESWSAWFSMAVWEGDLENIIGLYESRPEGAFEAWKQQHSVPDWLQPTIERWEQWKAKKHKPVQLGSFCMEDAA